MFQNDLGPYSEGMPGGGDAGGSIGSDGGVIGAVINAGAGLYDSYKNRQQSKWNTRYTNKAQKAEAELAYQRSVEMWHMQNAYNSPQAQMGRFKDAGLNPHLIYGQGNSGNASSTPDYHPADIRYQVEAPAYGAPIQSILPTLMAVGTWMQNMRLSETQIQRGGTETERARQLIEYLQSANPKTLAAMQNKLDLFPHQYNAQRAIAGKAHTTLADLEQEYRYKWGDDLFDMFGSASRQGYQPSVTGTKKLQRLQEISKTKLLDAKASWTDMNITDPQAIISMVLSGVMGMAGMTLRQGMSKGSSKRVQPRQRPRGLNRRRMSANHPDR